MVESEMGGVYEWMGEKQRTMLIHMDGRMGYIVIGHVQPRLPWSPETVMVD